MKKILLLMVFTFIFTLQVNAAVKDITITSAKYGNETIKITGTSTEENTQIAVFDGETNVIYGVAPVTSGNYNYESPKITLDANKEYIVKVFSLDGQIVKTSTLVFSNEANPKTGDNIAISIIAGGLSIFGIIGCILFLKKKNI